MKIKAVCEQTGLTPRTIRVYIAEGLLAPHYTENYLGRRNFEFSKEDVAQLRYIATLRRCGFAINEIRELDADGTKGAEILTTVKDRTQVQADVCDTSLRVLAQVDGACAGSLATLAEAILLAEKTLPKAPTHKRLFGVGIGRVLLYTLLSLPILFVLIGFFVGYGRYAYPKIEWGLLLFTLCTLLPAVGLYLLCRKRKRVLCAVLVACVLLCLPLNFFCAKGSVSCSQTTDIRQYRKLDAACLANRDDAFQALFPSWAHYFDVVTENGHSVTTYLDARYYYRFYQGMDYTYDIYAEWPLAAEDFASEVTRAGRVLTDAATDNGRLVELVRGDYTCLILYDGDEPFQVATDNYQYLIFAYNERTCTVRYLCCYSLENGADQPYYLELEW